MSTQNSSGFRLKISSVFQLLVKVCAICVTANRQKQYTIVEMRKNYFHGDRCNESRTVKMFVGDCINCSPWSNNKSL